MFKVFRSVLEYGLKKVNSSVLEMVGSTVMGSIVPGSIVECPTNTNAFQNLQQKWEFTLSS